MTLSSGKDSEATLWWAFDNLPFGDWEVLFNDLDWDHQDVYSHLLYLESRIGKKFIRLKSKGFKDKLSAKLQDKIIEIFGGENVFAEMVLAKSRFPSTKARFCSEILKVIPGIDYVLDNVFEDCTVIQGVRAEESAARKNLKESDDYFKFYFEPYGVDKKGYNKFHTYRKADVLAHCDKYTVNILRPILKLNANQVFEIIFNHNSPGNPLYRKGAKRVGCWPCIMCGLDEIRMVAELTPKRIEQLEQLEQLGSSTFFPPGFIPVKFCTKKARVKIYPDDLIRVFTTKPKPVSKQTNSLFQDVKILTNKDLYDTYFKNKSIPVHLDDDGDEYIIKTVMVPTIGDVVKYVQRYKEAKDLFPAAAGCVSVYNICETKNN